MSRADEPNGREPPLTHEEQQIGCFGTIFGIVFLLFGSGAFLFLLKDGTTVRVDGHASTVGETIGFGLFLLALGVLVLRWMRWWWKNY